jgi:hypothetical protein
MNCPNCGNSDKELIQRTRLRAGVMTSKSSTLDLRYGSGTEYYCLVCKSYFSWRKGTGFHFEKEYDDIEYGTYQVMMHLLALK